MSDARAPLGARFLVVWAGQTLSTIGSMLAGVGVAVHVFVETGSAVWLGLLSATASVPMLLVTPLLTLTDRFPRRTTMIVADAVAALGPVVALALATTGRLEVWHLVAASFVGGVGSAFQLPAAQAAVPALVAPDAIGRANALNQLGPALAIVVGPLAATPLVALAGIEAVLLVDVATFVVAVVTTASVRFADVEGAAVDDDGSWRAAFRWLSADGRPLVALLALMACVNCCLAVFNVGVLVLATELGGVARSGLVLGSAGVAMIVGSLVAAGRGIAPDRTRTFARGLMAAGGGFVISASYPALAVVIVGVVLALAAVPVLGATASTVFHERVPARMHGRVFGLRLAVGRALEPVGSVVGGLLVARVATPAMQDGGVLAGSAGTLIGVGTSRGAALVVALVGVVLLGTGAWLGRSWLREALRESVAPTDADAAPELSGV